MKKSTLLSLATAGAIVTTSAFTFAAWDQMDATKTATLTIRNPVTVTAAAGDVTLTSNTEYDSLPAYSADTTFALENVPSGYKIEPSVVVKKDGTQVEASKLTTELKVKDGENINISDKSKTVTVTVTPTEDAKDLAGTPLSVEVTAKLVKASAE